MEKNAQLMPKRMRDDPLLNTLSLQGPFGPNHYKLRETYYDIRDGKTPIYDIDTIEKAFEDVCLYSPGLFNRSDNTPKELSIICSRVNDWLSNQKDGD